MKRRTGLVKSATTGGSLKRSFRNTLPRYRAGSSTKQVEEMAPLIKALNIANYSTAVERAIETEDHKRLEEFKLRLSGGLDLYSLPQ